jgi:Ca-activated chloride channel family protein
MTRVALVPVLAGVALLGSTSAQQQTPTFRAGSETVAIYTTVVDAAGRLVPDLEREHFEVYDNGKLQDLTVFKSDVQPVSVVVTLDMSGSMTLHLDLLRQAAVQFVIRLLPSDRARINPFSDGRGRMSPVFTSDRDELIRYIHDDTQFGNGTRLWDAVDESMTALSKETGRRVVLVFTDGDDTDSKNADLDEVLARAQNEAYMVYAIGLRTRIPGQFESRPDRGLKKLADETGGGYFELTRATELGSAFTRVADELHRQYVLGFTASTLDGKPHKLDVRVKVPGMTARARKSYVATRSGS